jgi:hypothetical protein
VLLLAGPAAAQTTLATVDDVEWQPLRDHCRRLLRGLDAVEAPLPQETAKRLQVLLNEDPRDPEAAAREVQKLLDAHCLLGVAINPESRVKASRGPAIAELQRDREKIVLIKVSNDAGVTHPLAVTGPQLRTNGKGGEGRWLQAVIATAAPLEGKLTGQRLEYRVLRLTAREAGKREATFQFDVGQGTQDLGFRAEVPVLFTVR